jgi:hypothetical protein
MGDPAPDPTPELSKLRRLRGNPMLVFVGLVDHAMPEQAYELLQGSGRIARMDLVLSTNGGVASAARRLALLLREYTDHLTIIVPHRAWSAGTLLCLAADELLLGPMSELSPLDPRIGAVRGESGNADQNRDGPAVVSAEDVRAFRDLAREWFGVDNPEYGTQILALLSQRVSPVSLGGFFRADRLIRQLADELLAFHMEDEARRAVLVAKLVGGYHAHDHAITRRQARDLGLAVVAASAEEEALSWELLQQCRAAKQRSPDAPNLVLADLDHGATPGNHISSSRSHI